MEPTRTNRVSLHILFHRCFNSDLQTLELYGTWNAYFVRLMCLPTVAGSWCLGQTDPKGRNAPLGSLLTVLLDLTSTPSTNTEARLRRTIEISIIQVPRKSDVYGGQGSPHEMPTGLIRNIYLIDVPHGMDQFIPRFKANQIRIQMEVGEGK